MADVWSGFRQKLTAIGEVAGALNRLRQTGIIDLSDLGATLAVAKAAGVYGPQAAMAMRKGPVVPVPAKEVVALGAVGAVPAGIGVVVGDAAARSALETASFSSTRRSPAAESAWDRCSLVVMASPHIGVHCSPSLP